MLAYNMSLARNILKLSPASAQQPGCSQIKVLHSCACGKALCLCLTPPRHIQNLEPRQSLVVPAALAVPRCGGQTAASARIHTAKEWSVKAVCVAPSAAATRPHTAPEPDFSAEHPAIVLGYAPSTPPAAGSPSRCHTDTHACVG